MKTSTNTLLTGLAAAAALAAGGFAALNAWFISSPAFAEHEREDRTLYAEHDARDVEMFSSLTVTMESIFKNLQAAEKQRRTESIQNTEDSILFLKSMDSPPQHIERLENRRAREVRSLESLTK